MLLQLIFCEELHPADGTHVIPFLQVLEADVGGAPAAQIEHSRTGWARELSCLLPVDIPQMFQPLFVGCKLLLADWTLVPLVRAVGFSDVCVEAGIGRERFCADLAGEATALVSTGVVHHALRGCEALAAGLTDVVLIMVVHVFVEAEKHLVSLPADLAVMLVLCQLVRKHAVTIRTIDKLPVLQ